jgi:hypothetical protein
MTPTVKEITMPEIYSADFYVSAFPSPSTGGSLVLSPVTAGHQDYPGDLKINQATFSIPALNAQSCAYFWGKTNSCHRFTIIVKMHT